MLCSITADLSTWPWQVCLAACFWQVTYLAYTAILKIKALHSSETSVNFYQTIQCQIHSHRCENLKPYTFNLICFSCHLLCKLFYHHTIISTEDNRICGQMGSTYATCSEGPAFKSQPTDHHDWDFPSFNTISLKARMVPQIRPKPLPCSMPFPIQYSVTILSFDRLQDTF
jgi:hypothetical protein